MGEMSLEQKLEGPFKEGYPDRHRYWDDRLKLAGVDDPTVREKLIPEFIGLEEQNTELKNQIGRDGKTGLLNESGFSRFIESTKDIKYFLVIDIDNFKPLNDSWGHQAGDDLLKFIGGVLKDAVGEHGAVGRTGGDEFSIALTTGDSEIISKIKEDCQEPLKQFPSPVSLSIGGSPWDGKGNPANALEIADFNMLGAKEDKKKERRLEKTKYEY